MIPDPTLPTAPVNLTATAGDGQVSLSWTPSAEASSYFIYRRPALGTKDDRRLIARDLSTTSFTDTGLTNGSPYCYIVRARSTRGESDPSNEVSATPQRSTAEPLAQEQTPMSRHDETLRKLAELERALKQHTDAEVKNLNRLRTVLHPHTGAVCKAILALVQAFADRKVVILVEVEISELGWRARPEDIVAWIEGVGVFVLEVKSHTAKGIRRFENNVPQVVYQGQEDADVDLLDQPRSFAYKLKAEMEKVFDRGDQVPPPLYFAGWLPNVSPEDVASLSATVALDKVWLSDMLERDTFLARLPRMKNIAGSAKAERNSLEAFCKIFGATSGLRRAASPRATQYASMGHLIDRKNLQLKRLTKEQEDLAFSPNLVRGPKVIRGVAGSGKTVVLANSVAETLLRAMGEASNPQLFAGDREGMPQILVLCYNRALVPYLKNLIWECFESRKPKSEWVLPASCLKVMNVDRYAYWLTRQQKVKYYRDDVARTVEGLLKEGVPDRGKYQHVFIDEGQDVDLGWYRLVQEVTTDEPEIGRSIIVFYDEAQNLYGVRMPGVGGVSPWKEYLGAVPHNRGLHTVMRVGHRNTNEILSFSFNLLLGAFAEDNPQTVQFAGISEFEKEVIPYDPSIAHPHAGKPCVEKIDERQYRVNFAVQNGPLPNVHVYLTEEEMLSQLAHEVERVIDPKRGNVEPSDVLVMVPERRHARSVVSALAERKIQTHVPVKFDDENKDGARPVAQRDPRDDGCFVRGKVTVSTIKSAKGYTAHVCHLAYVHTLDGDALKKETRQKNRAQLHVACTRSSLFLDLWGTSCALMSEAEKARAALG
jgi:superfamily I DNA and RNA helicase